MEELTDIRVLIADDDSGMRTIMRKMIERADGFTLVGEAENGQQAIDMYEELRPQVMFLDVEMPEITGVECARIIQDTDPSVIFIFATAHDQYMGEAFEVYAFDYMIKPFKVDRVMKTLSRIRERLSAARAEKEADALPILPSDSPAVGKLMLHHKEGVSFIDMDDIILVQRENRLTVLYLKDNVRYETNESLGETEARLDHRIFFRCHKSYIINLNHINNITPYGRWTYVVRLNGTKQDALITHDKYEELERMFGQPSAK